MRAGKRNRATARAAVLSTPAQVPAMRKHRRVKGLNSRGETLVETLAAILIAVLSVALLLGSVTASGQLARQADQSDTSLFETLTSAEDREEALTASDGVSGSPTVTITEGVGKTATIPVQVYGGEDLYSYARKDPSGGEAP